MSPRKIEEASAADEELTEVWNCIKTNNFDDCPNTVYKTLRNELTVLGKLVLRGTSVVIPNSLRDSTVDIAHEGHQGMVKTKERLRTKVWWPNMDKDVERCTRSRHECQIVSQPSTPEPMVRTKFPEGPWEDLAIDLLGSLPNGDSILVVVDYYSRYFETTILRSTTAVKVIEALDDMFTTHGQITDRSLLRRSSQSS